MSLKPPMKALRAACATTARDAGGALAIACDADPDATACAIAWLRPAAGVEASASITRDCTWCWKIAPHAAIPVAIPAWRKVLLIPDAMPLRAGGTTPTAIVASDGFAIPTPTPAIRNPANRWVQPELTLRPLIKISAT